jgi:uncharacterized phage protein gp47/JayE
MTDLTPPKLTIDNYQELITDSLEHMKIVSNGAITDTSPAGFMRPFVGTLAFVASETLFLANMAAEAAAKTFLSEVVGVPVDNGAFASVTLEFRLSAQLTTPFTVPINFQCSDTSGTLRYYTTSNLVIPAGVIAGEVTAIAEEVGAKYNLSAGQINTFTTPLTYLASVVNITDATGGREVESPSDLVDRAAIAIRSRNPVSALDFEQLATLILGDGSRAKAIGLLAADKITKELGVVHLFLLNADGTQPSQAQISVVGSQLATRLMLGTKLLISQIELEDVYIDVIVNNVGVESASDLADNIFTSLNNYFDNRTYPIGGSVLLEEVKYIIRDVGGITIEYLEINQQALNISMPTKWTLPKFTGVNVDVIDGNSQQSFSLFNPIADE